MAELRTILADLPGIADVTTYIQSGNIVFTGGARERADVEATIAAAIESHFGFAVPVIVRDADVLATVLDRSAALHPVSSAESDSVAHDKRTLVGFLAAAPADGAVANLDPDRSPGDSVVVEGEHAHVSYAQGAGTTKLTGDYIERTLGVGMTMRNLATVRTLADMV